MKHLIFLFAAFLLLLSCGGSGDGQPKTNALPDDSAQLRIAVMPTIDCLPLYVAEESGLFQQAGIDVSLFLFQAQMDCDTALQRGHVNAVVSDLVRVLRMNEEDKLDLKMVTSTELNWQLLSARNARVTQFKQLDNKAMAMTRFSATHLLSQMIVDSAKVQPERVFLIQINDVNVRLNMLQNGIMDVLWLPEPQATEARKYQANILTDTHKLNCRMGVVAFKKGAATVRQVDAFKKAYNQACDSINQLGVGNYTDIIKRRCNVLEETIDSLPKNLTFQQAAAPRKADVEMATEWLKKAKTDPYVEK